MISYDPLFRTLEEKDLQLVDLLRNCELHPSTVAKFRKGASMTLTSIEKICIYLDVTIDRVVEIRK